MAGVPKRRFALLVGYDGGGFAGWQMQPGQRTVQETLGDALHALGITPRVEGASRTDKGVHARAMVVSISARVSNSPAELLHALRAHLPRDVRLRALAQVPEDFHAQFSSRGKRYRYQLSLQAHPTDGRFEWVLPASTPFSQRALQSALTAMVGRRTFAGAMHFSARRGLCNLTEARVLRQVDSPRGRTLVLGFAADRFGKYMVRTLVGVAVRAAQGELDPAQLSDQFDAELPLGQLVAPPQGLALWKVRFGPGCDPFPWLT